MLYGWPAFGYKRTGYYVINAESYIDGLRIAKYTRSVVTLLLEQSKLGSR